MQVICFAQSIVLAYQIFIKIVFCFFVFPEVDPVNFECDINKKDSKNERVSIQYFALLKLLFLRAKMINLKYLLYGLFYQILSFSMSLSTTRISEILLMGITLHTVFHGGHSPGNQGI